MLSSRALDRAPGPEPPGRPRRRRPAPGCFLPSQAARAKCRSVSGIAHGNTCTCHDGHPVADLEGRELEPDILKGVASNLAVVVQGHIVPHLRKGRVHQDHLVHAEEALPHARAKQAQDGGWACHRLPAV